MVELDRFNIDDVELPTRVIMYAKTNSGKSTYLKYTLYKCKSRFDLIYYYSPVGDFPDPKRVSPLRKREGIDVAEISRIIDHQQKQKLAGKKLARIAIVLEDAQNEIDLSNNKVIDKLFTKCRHYNMSVFITIQKAKALSTTIRGNCDYSVIFKTKNKTQIRALYDEFALTDMDHKIFGTLIEEETKDYWVIVFNNTSSADNFYSTYLKDRAER